MRAFDPIFQYDDYRKVLLRELNHRQARNNGYSQRAFARDLKIAPHRLSQVLSHKQGLSRSSAANIGTQLGLNGEEWQYFCDLVSAAHGRSQNERQAAQRRLEQKRQLLEFNRLHPEVFAVINRWYHLAIVELSRLKPFHPCFRWIGNRLGLQETQVQRAYQNLKKLGLLRFNRQKVERPSSFNEFAADVPNPAIRKFHKDMLQQAQDSIEGLEMQHRNLFSGLFAISQQNRPAYDELINEFVDRVSALGQTCDQPDQLYALTLQFFRIDRPEQCKEPTP